MSEREPLDVKVLESGDSDFPEALGRTGCDRVWAIGDPEILDQPLLGLFCSRRCPGDVILLAYDVARALRDAGRPVISGFHSPMERECLELLLRGRQPIVACPARGLERMRAPAAWKEAVSKGRMLVVSPFGQRHRRVEAAAAERRNRFVAAAAACSLVLHAAPKSGLERLCLDLLGQGRAIHALAAESNRGLLEKGAFAVSVDDIATPAFDALLQRTPRTPRRGS